MFLLLYHKALRLIPYYSSFISSPVRSTGSVLMSSPVRRRRRPMLTFAFRSNVDKLLGPD